jgi:hypothetical protein
MKPILSQARDYFAARFLNDDEDGTAPEERFKQALALGRLASLFRLHLQRTDADLASIVSTAPSRVLPAQADKDNIIREWKQARVFAQGHTPSNYHEPATRNTRDHVSINGEYCYKWWLKHGQPYPAMVTLIRRLVILQPSSAASERVFSLFKHVNDNSPVNTLMDRKRARVIVPYNDRMREKSVVPSN